MLVGCGILKMPVQEAQKLFYRKLLYLAEEREFSMSDPKLSVRDARLTFVSEKRESKAGKPYYVIGFASGDTRGKDMGELNDTDNPSNSGTFGRALCFGASVAALEKNRLGKGDTVDLQGRVAFGKEKYQVDGKDRYFDTYTFFVDVIELQQRAISVGEAPF